MSAHVLVLSVWILLQLKPWFMLQNVIGSFTVSFFVLCGKLVASTRTQVLVHEYRAAPFAAAGYMQSMSLFHVDREH
jgi:hypothetical protein